MSPVTTDNLGSVEPTEALEPVLRWAGGKRWLRPTIQSLVSPVEFENYFEPFLGGAAAFLSLECSGDVSLSDLNEDLIQTYEAIRNDPGGVASALGAHQNTSEYYYKLRDLSPADAVSKAARFIYLNHTSFNGIYRVNLAGKYNVPYGRRKFIRIPDEVHLRNFAARLKDVDLSTRDFVSALEGAEEKDLVFLDPPYTVAHENNGFVKYNQTIFAWEDQERLAKSIENLVAKKAYFILTNAAHPSIEELFGNLGRKIEVSRRSVIGGTGAFRGTANEYMFTNLPSDG